MLRTVLKPRKEGKLKRERERVGGKDVASKDVEEREERGRRTERRRRWRGGDEF